jgi:hypothetical protein
MSDLVSPVFMLSCVGNALETGLITVQRLLPTFHKINSSRLILMGNRSDDLTCQATNDLNHNCTPVKNASHSVKWTLSSVMYTCLIGRVISSDV